jgi:hypothetical protein
VQDDARSVLAQVINTHGQDLVDDPRRLRSILADSLPGSRREAQRLVAAVEEGIPRQILNAGADPTGALRHQMARRLQEERDMTPEAADWTVDSWASALDVDLGGPSSGFPGEPTIPVPTSDDDDVPPPRDRRGLWLALAALAGLAVAIALFVVLDPFQPTGETGTASATATASMIPSASDEPSDEPSPTREVTPEPTPTPTPNPQERLLARISSEIRDTCSDADWSIGEPIAQVNCDTVGMDNIAYLLYASTDEMRRVYDEWKRGEEEGDCAGEILPAERGWSLVGQTRRELGRYSCFRSDSGTAYILWSTYYADIIALGYRDDGDFEALWKGWARAEVRPRRGVGS